MPAAQTLVRGPMDRAAKAYARQVAAAGRRYVKRLRAAIGSRNIKPYLALRRTARQTLRDARRRLPDTPRGRRQLDIIRAEILSASRTFFRSRHIDVRRIQRLQTAFLKSRRALYQSTVERALFGSKGRVR